MSLSFGNSKAQQKNQSSNIMGITAPAVCKHISQNSPQRLHFASISTLWPGEYPNFKIKIKMGEEEHARGHTGARKIPKIAFPPPLPTKLPSIKILQTSPQRLHFASISPPNIPTAPAFCKHVSPNIPTAPAFRTHLYPIARGVARTHTQAHTKEHAIYPQKSHLLPFCKGSIQTSKSKSKWERRSTHARTQERAKSPLVTFHPTPIVLALCLPKCGFKFSTLTDHSNKISAHLSSNLNPSIAKRKNYINISPSTSGQSVAAQHTTSRLNKRREREKRSRRRKRERNRAHSRFYCSLRGGSLYGHILQPSLSRLTLDMKLRTTGFLRMGMGCRR